MNDYFLVFIASAILSWVSVWTNLRVDNRHLRGYRLFKNLLWSMMWAGFVLSITMIGFMVWDLL